MTQIAGYAETVRKLKSARSAHAALHAHFETFCHHMGRLTEPATSFTFCPANMEGLW